MTEETLGKRIVAHRKKLGLTQDALAEQLGVTAQAVSKWENDLSCPDIAMLPKLAGLFGITVDALLGLEKEEETPETSVPETTDASIQTDAVTVPGRRMAVGFALWLLVTGGLLMAVQLLPGGWLFPVPLWQAACLTGLTLFGLFGIYPRFSLFRLSCGLIGGYYLYCCLCQPRVMLNEELLLPLLLVFFGLGLLVDAIRGKKLSAGHRDWQNIALKHFEYGSGTFVCRTCFGDDHKMIELEQLEGGSAELEFGELTVDLRNCRDIGADCCIFLKCAFGELSLYVPRQWRLQCLNKTAFGTVREYGCADPDAEGTIRVESSVSFGEIKIKYV